MSSRYWPAPTEPEQAAMSAAASELEDPQCDDCGNPQSQCECNLCEDCGYAECRCDDWCERCDSYDCQGHAGRYVCYATEVRVYVDEDGDLMSVTVMSDLTGPSRVIDEYDNEVDDDDAKRAKSLAQNTDWPSWDIA